MGIKPVYALLAFLVLMMLLGLGISRSSTGLALICKYLPTIVPGLTVDYASGNLAHARFQQIRWQDEQIQVRLEDVEWQLNLICLIDNRLCIKQLDIRELIIKMAGSGNGTPLDLDPIILPLEIDLTHGNLQTLQIINQTSPAFVLQDLELAALWRYSFITIHRLNARQDGISAKLVGRMELQEQLPLEISGDVSYTRSDQQHFAGRIRLDGDLNQLTVKAWLEQPEPLALTGHIRPLSDPISLSAIVTSDATLAIPGSQLTVRPARLEVTGTLQRIEGELTASISEPMLGASDLKLSATWDGSALQIGALHLHGDAATLDGTGKVAFEPELNWQFESQLRLNCLASWSISMECSLDGQVQSSGSLNDNDFILNLAGDMFGQVNGEPAAIKANADAYPGNRWALHAIDLSLGASSVHMHGKINEELALSGDLVLADLGQVDPAWQGRGQGQWQLTGNLEAPILKADLSFQSLQSGDLLISAVDVTGNWSGWPGSGSVQLDAQGGRWGKVEVESLNLGCDVSIENSPAGQVDCSQLDLTTDSILGNWQLGENLTLSWQDPASGFSIAPFCLNSAGPSLCSTGTPVFQGKEFQDVHLIANNIAVAWLRNFLPPEIELSGTLGISLDAENLESTGPRIELSTSGQQMTLGVYSEENLIQQPITKLNGRLLWNNQQLAVNWNFAMGEKGASNGNLAITDWETDKNLNGTFNIQELELAPFILPNEGVLSANGSLNGTVRLQGNVSNPLVTGKLQLTGGRLEHERLPTPLEELNLDISFDGPEVVLLGGFTVAAGSGSLSGNAQLGDESWLAELNLLADNLIIAPLRGSEMTLQPDLNITLTRDKATIHGDVIIPRASIVMDRLPQTAKKISPDTIIVGEEREPGGFGYELDLNVRLGEQVNVRALGANANLAGHIELTQLLDQPLVAVGEIEIISGRYLAYGQRLEVQEGKLFFNGPLQRPQIRLVALRPMETVDIQVGVRVGGDAKYPEIELFSKPSMDENLAMYYLLTGHAPEAGTNLELAVATAMLQLGISGASKNTTSIMEKLGIQNFQVDARQQEEGTEFNVSGYLSSKLYLGYGVSTFEKVNTVRARYRLQQKLYLEAISGADSAIDFLYSITR